MQRPLVSVGNMPFRQVAVNGFVGGFSMYWQHRVFCGHLLPLGVLG
jgi:hypothetical protein